MTLQELATAVIYDIPVIVAVMNNGWLGMVRQWQELFHDERFSQTHLIAEMPDYVKLAEAFGALGFRVESEAEVDVAILAARGERPAGRDRLPRRPRGEGLPDGARPARLGRHDRRRPGSRTTTRGSRRASDGRAASTHITRCRCSSRTSRACSRASRACSRGAASTSSRLAVGPTERPDRSCITIRVDCPRRSIDQVVKQLYKLDQRAQGQRARPRGRDRARAACWSRSRRAPDKRGELIRLAEVFGARVVRRRLQPR